MGTLTINSEALNAPRFVEFIGGYNVLNSANSCSQANNSPTIVGYLPVGQNFATATGIFTDDTGTTPSANGRYSDGTISRQWNSSNQTFSNTLNC